MLRRVLIVGMTVRNGEVNLSHAELQALCDERETIVHALRQEIAAIELQRDQALRGLELLTQALRRRGCCDHDTNNASL